MPPGETRTVLEPIDDERQPGTNHSMYREQGKMFRLRRYRVFLAFAAISILAFVHFSGLLQEWATATPAVLTQSPPQPQPQPQDDQKPPPGASKESNPTSDEPEGKSGYDNGKLPGLSPETDEEPSDKNPPPDNAKAPGDSSGGEEKEKEPVKSEQTSVPQLGTAQYPDDEFVAGGVGRLEVPGIDRSDVRWTKPREHFPVPSSDMKTLPTGPPQQIPKIQFDFPPEPEKRREARMEKLSLIKDSFLHAWNGYKENAMGRDEVNPINGMGRDPFMGWGATLVDSLDTLWIMGLRDEFDEAVEQVRKIDFKSSKRKDIPVFETVIRYLGGLLGAYDISEGQYKILLDKAVELAEVLMGAFDTPNRMPATFYNWAPTYTSQPHRAGTRVVLAEIGSLSVEFTRLAQITGDNKYYDAIARITDALEKWQKDTKLPGLWPFQLDASGCKKAPALEKQTPRDASKDGTPTVPKQDIPEKIPAKRDTSTKKEDPIMADADPADYDARPHPDDLKEHGDAENKKKKTPAEAQKPSDYDCLDQGLHSIPRSVADQFTLGAPADSAYEYLPKEHLLLGGLNDQYRTMYENAMKTTRDYLLFRPMLPRGRDVRFIASASSPEPPKNKKDLKYTYEGSHLGCYAGAMFGIGAKVFGLEGDLDIAKKLTDGCVWAYETTVTHIMPEHFELLPCESMEQCTWNQTRYYDAIDPFENERKARLEFWQEQKAKLKQGTGSGGKGVPKSPETNKIPDPKNNPGPLPHGAPDQAPPADGPPAQEAPAPAPASAQDPSSKAQEAPAFQAPANGAGDISKRHLDDEIDADDEVLSSEWTVLSHKDFAEKRIKEERIPPGMTNVKSAKYRLRPEAIESVFVMYRLTGEDYWRRKGWEMFIAVEQETRTELGNSAIRDVNSHVPYFLGEMESFWLGETLKYFYLLFSDSGTVNLDDFIFNTEAHPLKRPKPDQAQV